jgi:hypothetical protein
MVKEELATFLCTNDKKYRELWSRINALEKKGSVEYPCRQSWLTATVEISLLADMDQ